MQSQIMTQDELPIPNFPVDTPSFVILMDAVEHNFERTVAAIGGVQRLVPHVKTHRAPWLIDYQLARGVRAFKTATPMEVEMVLAAGAPEVIWAYPTVNRAAIARVVDSARKFPNATVVGLVDSSQGLDAWVQQLAETPASNVRLRVDLDPGMGRTGVKMSTEASVLAREVHSTGLFAGWHIYDGHVQDTDRNVRVQRVGAIRDRVREIVESVREDGCVTDVIAGGSYTFDLWPVADASRVSPGSWIFSSSQHQAELSHLGWQVGAYVLATVMSTRDGTATVDAGSKAISPDMPMTTRFQGGGKIRAMKEEHTIIESESLAVGDRLALVPRHACTTAYLYPSALVRLPNGDWERRTQLGNAR